MNAILYVPLIARLPLLSRTSLPHSRIALSHVAHFRPGHRRLGATLFFAVALTPNLTLTLTLALALALALALTVTLILTSHRPPTTLTLTHRSSSACRYSSLLWHWSPVCSIMGSRPATRGACASRTTQTARQCSSACHERARRASTPSYPTSGSTGRIRSVQ